MLKSRWLIGGAALALACGVAAVALLPNASTPVGEKDAPLPEPRPAPAPLDPVRSIAMAPSGADIAFVSEGVDGASLWLAPSAAKSPQRLLRRTDADAVLWSLDGNWLFLISGTKLVALTLRQAEGSGIVTQLGETAAKRFLRIDNARPAAALVAEEHAAKTKDSTAKYSLARYFPGGKREALWSGSQRPNDAVVAGDGTIFMRLIGKDTIAIWRVSPNGRAAEYYRCRSLERCSLVAAGEDGGLIMATSAGHDLDGLVTLDAAGRVRRHIADPQGSSDVSAVVTDPTTQVPLAALYPFAGAGLAAVHPSAERLVAAVQTSTFRPVEVRLQAAAEGQWLVGLRANGAQAMRWHRFSNDDPRLLPLDFLPSDPGQLSAGPQRVLMSHTASDGMRLFAYVTRPQQTRGPLPVIVLAHGGPWSASPIGFNRIADGLARRGYLVVEPQFRASRGYGRHYLLAGGSDFGDGAVLRDIRDSADWVIATQNGDPARTVIMGASFGGYAALLATTLWPERFKGAVALVPPSDFAWNLRYAAGNPAEQDVGVSQRASLEALGADPANAREMARLSAQSPSARVASLQRPVLIMAGGNDRQVPIRSVNHYVARLCQARKDVSYYVAASSGHSLADARQRDEILSLVSHFLDRAVRGTARESLPKRVPGLQYRPCSMPAGSGTSPASGLAP